MLSLNFITIHPSLIHAYESFGVFRSAQEQGLASIQVTDLRAYSDNNYGSVDGKPYGGGDSMIMRPEPLTAAITSMKEPPYVILTSPAGTSWRHQFAMNLCQMNRPIALICARFGGVDQRFIDKYVHAEYSVGDFVLSGGELPCLMIADSILRLVPGVLGNDDSARMDSFTAHHRGQLEHPVYTRPAIFEGEKVPDDLLSGDHARVARWKSSEALRRTISKRPDLI